MSEPIRNSQHFTPIVFREGYPVSSEKVNDAFDAVLYDLIAILTTPTVDVSSEGAIFKSLVDTLSEVEGLSSNRKNKQTETVISGHTPNWRHI